MSVNKSVVTMLRRSNALSSLLCNRYAALSAEQQQQQQLSDCKHFCTKVALRQKPDWNRALAEAEKVVGYPTSFFSLRWLLNDETANVALHLRRLVGTNHPLLRTSKSLIYNGRNNMQAWGLIVLLVSKAAGHLHVGDVEEDQSAGVLQCQRALAEVTEMIRTSHIVHKGLINFQPDTYSDPNELDNMTFGNKIALLSGDYLLGKSSVELANIENQDLVELMSSAVKDLSEAEFLGRRDGQNNPLPSVPPTDRTNYAVNEWTLYSTLSSASLLGKACKGTLKLAGHSEEVQEQGYEFGKHLGLAWQAFLDLGPFISRDKNTPFNLCSAPVMFHIEHDPSILVEIDKGLESVDNVDYAKVYDIVISGPGIELTKNLQQEHLQCALEVLSVFQESDAQKALTNLIVAMGDF